MPKTLTLEISDATEEALNEVAARNKSELSGIDYANARCQELIDSYVKERDTVLRNVLITKSNALSTTELQSAIAAIDEIKPVAEVKEATAEIVTEPAK